MKRQISFAEAESAGKKRVTRRQRFLEITSSLVYGPLIAGDVKRRVSAEPVDRLAPVRRP